MRCMRSGIGLGIAATVLCGALAATAWAARPAAVARGGEYAGPGGHNRPLLRCLFENAGIGAKALRELNLAPEQKQQIGEILKNHKPEIAACVRAIHEKRQVLLAAVRADAVNEGAIRSASAQLGSAIGEGSVLRANVRREVRAVLTPEQRAKLDEALSLMEQNADKAVDELGAQ